MAEKNRILIAGIGGASLGTEIAKCLTLAGNYEIFGADISPLAYGHYMKDFKRTAVVSEKNYVEEIIRLCIENKIHHLVPGGEKPTVILSQAVDLLRKNEITFIGNEAELVGNLSDKKKTFEILKRLNFEIPLTKEIDYEEELNDFPFPCIVKPATGSGGSDSVFLAGNKAECVAYLNFLKSGDRKIIVQEYIPVTEGEFTIGVLSLPDETVVSCIAMQRIFNSKLSVAQNNKFGLISSGYSQGLIKINPELEKQAKNIAKKLGSKGPLNIQARVRSGVLIPFEINPRFSASTYLRALAGVNELDFFMRYLISGEKEFTYKVKEGHYLRSFTETFIPITK